MICFFKWKKVKIALSFWLELYTTEVENHILTLKESSKPKWIFGALDRLYKNRRNDPLPLQLCEDWRVLVYLPNKSNFIQNKFVDGEL